MSKPKARFICTKPQGLGTGTTVWLQKHGVSVRPTLSDTKIKEITAVFELFDEDGSGAIETDEAENALRLLGMNPTKSQVAKLVENYDVNDSGDLDLDEFIQMMTEHLLDEEDSYGGQDDSFDMNSLKDSGFNTNELNLVLGALRRRNLLQALLEKDYKGIQAQKKRLGNSVLSSIPELQSPDKKHKHYERAFNSPTQQQLRAERKKSLMMLLRAKKKLKLPKIEVPKRKSIRGGLESPEPKVKVFTGKSPLLRKGNYHDIAQKISQGKYSTPLIKTFAGSAGGAGAPSKVTVLHKFPGLNSYLAKNSMKSTGRRSHF